MTRSDILNKIKSILSDDIDSLGFSVFIHYPTVAVREEDTPCLFLYEGLDKVRTKSSRSKVNSAVLRDLNVVFEVLDNVGSTLNRTTLVRELILSHSDEFPQVDISEVSIEGPMGSGVPDILVCRLTLLVTYNDS